MAIYELAYRFHKAPDPDEIWLIERITPGELSYRLHFRGTREEAEAEVARLNGARKGPH